MHITSLFSSLVFVMRIEEKLLAQVVYHLFKHLATNMLRRFTVLPSSGSQVKSIRVSAN